MSTARAGCRKVDRLEAHPNRDGWASPRATQLAHGVLTQRHRVGRVNRMTHHTATVTTDHGNTAIVDIASHAADELAGIGPVEGMVPSADLIAAKLSGRHFDCWADLNDAIADLVANDPSVFVRVSYDLYDGDTGQWLGEATDAQVAASLAARPDGGILIDADGDVVIDGTWAAQQPGVRKVYVA